MKWKTLSVILSGVLLLGQFGCTSMLWEDTDPNELIWIDAKEITEEELQRRGVEYEVYSSETGNGYLVEKTAKDKFKDFHFRMLGAPVTLVTDAAAAAGAVAGVVVCGYLYSLSDGPVVYY